MPRRCPTRLGLLVTLLVPVLSHASDWPMWRHDAGRSAATSEQLPETLHLQWSRTLPPLKPAWPDQPKMQLDAVYQPIVIGHRLIVGSSRDDCVTAYNTSTGDEIWRFHADGPIRYPAAGWQDRVFVAADDGYLYCLSVANGAMLWKFRGGASDRKLLGNERVISMWPARGSPVVADGTVYFAAGIWPFMGIFLHAVDARTGKVVWTNDGDGSVFIKQPHNSDSFAGIAPQGPLVVSGDRLIIPGGRSVPACYDRKTGKLLYYLLAENGKRGGGSVVAASERVFFNGGAAFDVTNGKYMGTAGSHVAFNESLLFAAEGDECRALDLAGAKMAGQETVDRKGNTVKTTRWSAKDLGAVGKVEVTALMAARERIFVGMKGRIAAYEHPVRGRDDYAISWKTDVEGIVTGLLAADDKLFAVTREGRILAYGGKEVTPRHHSLEDASAVANDQAGRAHSILEAAGVNEGYCIVWGAGDGKLVLELLRQSELRQLVMEPDERKADELRTTLRRVGIPAERVHVMTCEPAELDLPPYLASLMILDKSAMPGMTLKAETLAKMFRSLRPYGGVLWLGIAPERRDELNALVKQARLEHAVLKSVGGPTLLIREGALPGSANWTHEHADASNTRVSRDHIVKAPLGLLWFGGPSNDGILPRHGHGPQPQVVDGRIIIEGVDMLRAMDVYTGRILWETKLQGVGVLYDNLAHQPGANAAGTNYISTSDGIYVAYGKLCVRLDPATGQKLAAFRLPAVGDKLDPAWGYINVLDDYLISGADPLFDAAVAKEAKATPKEKTDDDPPKKDEKPDWLSPLAAKVSSRATNDNFSSSKSLVVMDRHSGKVLWTATAKSGFRHNAICAGGGRVYCIDRLSGPQVARMKRRGETPSTPPRLVVFDLKTGEELWHSEANIFGTWLSYSAERDLLVEAGRTARDTLNDEPTGMRAYRAADGKVQWYEAKYPGPAMIHGDTIHMAGKACDLVTGKIRMRKDALTDEDVEWAWTRNYGCNTPAASEHLLTFRSGAAGYYDLCNDGGTGNLGGFRSSCTNNLIVANGVLAAPDYTRTCTCAYQNQTSLAFIHMPEAEMWTHFGPSLGKGPVAHIGLNFGAPGDRRADNGTLWVEYPSLAGRSPAIVVKTTPAKPVFLRRHSSVIVSGEPAWVGSSAAKGLTSLGLDLREKKQGEGIYTVRLYFAELEGAKPGERICDIDVQGKRVLTAFDIAKESGGPYRMLVKEIRDVHVQQELVLKFTAQDAAHWPALLNGIEVVAQEK